MIIQKNFKKLQKFNLENETENDPFAIISVEEDIFELSLNDFNKNKDTYYFLLKNYYNLDSYRLTKNDYIYLKEKYYKLKNNSASMDHVTYYNSYIQEISEFIENYKEQLTKENLYNTSIDDFAKKFNAKKLKLDILKDYRIFTVGDLINEDPFYTDMDGIGPATEGYYLECIRKFKEIFPKVESITFNVYDQPYNETVLLKKLKPLVENSYIVNSMNVINKLYKPLQRAMEGMFEFKLQYKNSSFKFYENLRNKINNLTDQLNILKDLPFDIKNEIKESSLNNTEVWDHYVYNAPAYYAILEQIFGEEKSLEELDILKRSSDLPNKILDKMDNFIINSNGLNGVLRKWQRSAVKYALIQKRVLIGDEMGLGKTLISIGAMVHLANYKKNKFVVICPTSLMINWKREIEKFSGIKVHYAHGKNVRDIAVEKWKSDGGVLLTTYGTCKKLDIFKEIITMLTIDEAHYAKNPKAKRSKIVYDLSQNSEYVLFLTGTPIENKVQEMVNLIYILQPIIADEIENKGLEFGNPIRFREVVAPVYLRRTKEDVKLELPKLTQIEEWSSLSSVEAGHYHQEVARGNFMGMRQCAWLGGTLNKSPKLKRLSELLKEAKENNEKVIIFTFFLKVIKVIQRTFPEYIVGVINGSVPSKERQNIIDHFSKSLDKHVLVTQIATASLGLNIQSANMIIFCEPQIKPSYETQAIARAYRMGQVNNVTVYRLLTENSIDERMMELLDTKQQVFDDFADKSNMTETENMRKKYEDISEFKISKKIIELERKKLGIPAKIKE